MIAHFQERSCRSQRALFRALYPGMAKLSDESEAASKVRDGQAARLTRLRARLGLTVGQAAEMAGVSRFTWSRMEQGTSNLDGVALARFVNAARLPAEYVVTGRHDGLPPALVRELVQVEVMEQEAGGARTPPLSGPAPRGRKRQTRSPHSASAAKQASSAADAPEKT